MRRPASARRRAAALLAAAVLIAATALAVLVVAYPGKAGAEPYFGPSYSQWCNPANTAAGGGGGFGGFGGGKWCDEYPVPTGQHFHCERGYGMGIWVDPVCSWRWADNAIAPPPPI